MNFYIEQNGRARHVVQVLNGNKCNAYFVSGKIKESKKNADPSLIFRLISCL